jgi:nucleoside-diphosphate-sugar epimerase
LHLAWVTAPGAYWTSLENINWVQASLALMQMFKEQGGERLVVAGTCAEYNWSYGFCSEQITPLAPNTLYGVCKNSLGQMLAAFAEQTGLSAAWGRIFFLYGPHEYPQRLVPYVINALLRGQPALCTHGDQIRGFLYVEDLGEALVRLLESNVSGPVNIDSGHPVALKEVILKIAGKLKRPNLIHLGARPTPANEPLLLVGDTRRLTEEVKWQPRFDLDEGLEKTIAWWKAQL